MIAAIQIVGGIVAAIMGVAMGRTLLDHAVVELLAAAAVAGGVGVWRDAAAGYWLSLGLQTVQILRVRALAFTYLVSAGVTLAPGVQNGRLAVVTALGAGVLVGPGQPVPGQVAYQAANDPAVFIGFNLAALISLLVLWAAAAEARSSGTTRTDEGVPAA